MEKHGAAAPDVAAPDVADADVADADVADSDFGLTPARDARDSEESRGLTLDQRAAQLGRAFRRPGVQLATAAVAVLVVVAVVLAVVLPGGGLPSNAAFSVNGKVTTVNQLDTQVSVLNKLQGVAPPPMSDIKAYGGFLRTAAKALAVQELVGDAAKKRGITIPQKSTRDYLDQLVAGSQTNLTAALQQAGVSEPQVLTALNGQQVENQLYSKVTHPVNITADQVTATFNAQAATLVNPEQRAISHIVVADQNSAQSILTQVSQGASFATLAQQDSLDASTKAGGGSLGTVGKSQLATPFGPAAFAAPLNVPFGPIQESGGAWDVGVVTAITPAVTYTNDAQTQAAIKNYVTDQQLRTQWVGYLASLIKHADIAYASKFRPTNPSSPPQPALPSLLSFVVNAHQSVSSPGSTSGAPTTPPAGP